MSVALEMIPTLSKRWQSLVAWFSIVLALARLAINWSLLFGVFEPTTLLWESSTHERHFLWKLYPSFVGTDSVFRFATDMIVISLTTFGIWEPGTGRLRRWWTIAMVTLFSMSQVIHLWRVLHQVSLDPKQSGAPIEWRDSLFIPRYIIGILAYVHLLNMGGTEDRPERAESAENPKTQERDKDTN